ncbi:NAD(P)/FAD-dependent oxidoreductase [Streptomyces sp. DG1A-41]|uniref:phytoene desaturase family protein n=1 Tax=Streptomyces sp. DG1A-41 TaxID=3125779 RepID=UPI0030CFD38B
MSVDAVVVGSGPNGLAAAVTLARAGLAVEVFEAHDTIGGGLRTEALFDSDVVHDICSAVHPMAVAAPFFREFDLPARGVELRRSDAAYAHPLPDGPAAVAYRDLARTCERLGRDGPRWRRLMEPLTAHSEDFVRLILQGPTALGRVGPRVLLALGTRVLAHGTPRAPGQFTDEPARALLTGVAAHAIGPLPSIASGTVAMLLGHLAHTSGWPLPRGGSARIAQALADDLIAHGGTLYTGIRVDDLRDLPPARIVLLDISPKEVIRIAGHALPAGYARRLRRFRYGPGAAKADFLLSEPVPWADPDTAAAATVHLGGTQQEMFHQETRTARGSATGEPFVLLVDPTVADPTRARPGKRPLWAYAHVPNGSTEDPLPLIRARIERYAPGFTDTVVAERATSAAAMEQYNPNYVGGDIGAGAMTLGQSLFRPTIQRDPYRTPLPGVYLCSASTPPGPSVHGMSGYLAARSALRREAGVREFPALAP